MNYISDLGQAVDVWQRQQMSETIPDRSFVPISQTGIEYSTDYEPVVYQSNRALMEANAAQELNELQERNHATTAYSTLDCVATPLFPTFNAQRASMCAKREDQLMASTKGKLEERRVVMAPERRVVMAPERRVVMAPERREACGTQNDNTMPYHNLYNNQAYLVPLMEEEEEMEDDSDEEPEQDDARPVPFARKMVNSVRGSLYDLQHWDKLTPTLNGENTCGILKYTLTRDTRAPYLLLWVSLLLLLIILICLAITVGIKKR
jgi:hypothetical protein